MSISKRDNTLKGARNLGTLSGSKQLQGFVGRKDKIDFAKFTLSGASNFEVNLQRLTSRASARVTLRNSRGSILASFEGGAKPQAFSSRLAAGAYYLGVQHRKGEVKYKIKTSVSAEPNEVSAARDIGLLSGTYTNADSVGITDTVDFYKFTLNDVTNLQARVNSATSTRFELIRDINNNGLIDAGEVITSDTDYASPFVASVTEDLPAGTYYAKIAPSSKGSTNYQLNLVATPFSGNILPEPGNTLPTARDLGALSGTFSARDYVGKLDATDLYRFTLNDISNLQATLKGASSNTKIQLIRDSNNNGLVDNGEILATDTNYGSIFVSSVAQDLPAGSYFIQVEPSSSSRSTNYELNLVTTPFGGNISPDPGNTLPSARDLGVLGNTTFSAKEYVGLVDADDFYKFTVNSDTSLQVQATGTSANTRIQLIRDSNNNGFIDNNSEVLSSDSNYSSSFISKFNKDLKAGSYFIRVIPRDQGTSTNYSLNLTVG